MQIEIIRDVQAFEALRSDWDALLEKSASTSVFLTWEWLFSWWGHFRNQRSLWILLARDETSGALLGIAPLCRRTTRLGHLLPLRKIEFLGSEKVASDFLDFILAPGTENEVLNAWFEHLGTLRDWDWFEFSALAETSLLHERLKKLSGTDGRILEKNAIVCPYIPLPADEKVFFSSLSPKMRHNLKHQYKRLSSEYPIRFASTQDPTRLSEDIDRVFHLHNARYDQKANRQHVSNFNGETLKLFHNEVAAGFLSRGWLELYFLFVGEEAIGCIYGFHFKKTFCAYQTGFNPDWAKWSPGYILFEYAIRSCFISKAHEFHFLRGQEAYKAKWAKTAKHLKTPLWFNLTLRGFFYEKSLSLKKSVKTLLLKSGWLKTKPDEPAYDLPVSKK